MTINRRDTILIAVLMNVGLLTILFITAMQFDGDEVPSQPFEHIAESTTVKNTEPEHAYSSHNKQKLPADEMDQVLEAFVNKQEVKQTMPYELKEEAVEITSQSPVKQESEYVSITVKKGDSLDKIARANKTTIREIKQLNQLSSDRLRIGQVLNLPLPMKKGESNKTIQSHLDSDDAVYYEIQSGDNPWKIAKKFQVRYDDIIQLNQLDEAKAKRLKVGDKIRIK